MSSFKDNLPLYKRIVDGMKFTELFENVGKTHYFETYEPLDTNMSTMSEFLINWQVPVECICIDDGSMVILQHPTFDFKLGLSASGDGDYTHHKVETYISGY